MSRTTLTNLWGLWSAPMRSSHFRTSSRWEQGCSKQSLIMATAKNISSDVGFSYVNYNYSYFCLMCVVRRVPPPAPVQLHPDLQPVEYSLSHTIFYEDNSRGYSTTFFNQVQWSSRFTFLSLSVCLFLQVVFIFSIYFDEHYLCVVIRPLNWAIPPTSSTCTPWVSSLSVCRPACSPWACSSGFSSQTPAPRRRMWLGHLRLRTGRSRSCPLHPERRTRGHKLVSIYTSALWHGRDDACLFSLEGHADVDASSMRGGLGRGAGGTQLILYLYW